MTKGRDSGMPPLKQWESYFEVDGILEALGSQDLGADVVEFGCGYGTFTIPFARNTRGTFYALDIDPFMVATTQARALENGLNNVIVERRDFVAQGSGRASQTASLVLLFNILHIEEPVRLLKEAHRVLHSGGKVGIIHWNYDAGTPRGPPLDIRPKPAQCRAWGEQAGLQWVREQALPGSPWHWGMVLAK